MNDTFPELKLKPQVRPAKFPSPKHLKLWFIATISPYCADADITGMDVTSLAVGDKDEGAKYCGASQMLSNWQEVQEWMEKHNHYGASVNTYWGCADCERPDGGRMCRQCIMQAGYEPGDAQESYAK